MQDRIRDHLENHRRAMALVDDLSADLERCARLLIDVLAAGGKILILGNGGSAADAQHFAAELVGRFRRERRGLPALALSTDSSILTALGNDYGFDAVFRRQVEALARPGDAVFGISTSGHSENVRLGLAAATAIGCRTVGLLGRDGGPIASGVELALVVPAEETARIQEVHVTLIHILCDLVEEVFAREVPPGPPGGEETS